MEKSLSDKLRESVVNIEKYGLEYAKNRAISWQLQEMRKVILAEEARKSSGASNAESETLARCTSSYKLHLDGTKQAILAELTSKAKLERWRAQWESIRSMMSFEKTQMKVFQEE